MPQFFWADLGQTQRKGKLATSPGWLQLSYLPQIINDTLLEVGVAPHSQWEGQAHCAEGTVLC